MQSGGHAPRLGGGRLEAGGDLRQLRLLARQRGLERGGARLSQLARGGQRSDLAGQCGRLHAHVISIVHQQLQLNSTGPQGLPAALLL